ncbi:hypothetical protein EW146_g8014 [Bondarzewia mesenterica]|uniref:Histone acetyltransferase n=1 Tax=Bondarzewia mesenterica TaxID=1095465 RepID=A0A4S4LHN7_9AGAM|nr:hypothetical protein EW146_g8014 [Bondarzewia mesenterica]
MVTKAIKPKPRAERKRVSEEVDEIMARGGHSPAPAALPKVSFVKVDDDFTKERSGVHDQQSRSYGYNDLASFHRPEAYIHYIEPLENELAKQVEYDMDEQDKEWLDDVNAERKAQQLDRISFETFEIVMDRLEKEWFHLTKDIPKTDMAMPSEDSTCAICDDSEGENTNAIVFCDGCNLAVHQDCYGVPYIPEGQWLCRKCTVSPEIPVSCILCPNEGGAFKQTVHGDWVHLLCAIWVPETRVANDVFMEPITGMEKISKQRWKLKCQVCDVRQGACIQCSKTSCFLAFHVTCARKQKLLMPMKATSGSEPPALQCFCERHLPRAQAEARAVALAAEEEEAALENPSSPKSSKTARAYAKTYKLGPPLVPAVIVSQILQYISKIIVRKKPEFVEMVARYWSLKREARRGAPLLKRLHLEPWTASGNKNQTDEEKTMKLEASFHMKRLRKDLEHVRMLAELCRKRESRKLKQSEVTWGLISNVIIPHEHYLRDAFKKITGLDRSDYFRNSVSKTEVPDYFEIIKNPIHWTAIEEKLHGHEYCDVQTFKDDINLVLDNAILYNKPGTAYSKAAQRIKAASVTILADLDALVPASRRASSTSFDGKDSAAMNGGDEARPETKGGPFSNVIGDLEPPLSILNLFVSDDIKEEIDLIVDTQPIVSILDYELERRKPPPPPPPPKPKRDRKADRERKRLEREAQMLDAAPGFRALRTRRAAAAAAAFEAEAQETAGAGPSGVPIPVPVEGQPHEPLAEVVPLTSAVKKGKAKRAAPVLPGHFEPPMVTELNPQATFKLFDQGWILAPDQKRGGRVAVDRGALPPPRKRVKRGTSKAQLSPGVGTSSLPELEVHAVFMDVQSVKPSSPTSSGADMSARISANTMGSLSEPVVQAQAIPEEYVTGLVPPSTVESATAKDISMIVEEPAPAIETSNAAAMFEDTSPGMEESAAPASLSPTVIEPKADTSGDISLSAKELPPPLVPSDEGGMVGPTTPVAEEPSTIGEPPERPEVAEQYVLEPNEKFAQDVDGTVYIEELDTPQTRRAKYMRRRSGRTRGVSGSSLTAPPIVVSAPVAGPSHLPAAMDDSELSSLSESDAEDDTKQKPRKGKAPLVKASSSKSMTGEPQNHGPGAVILEEGKMLDGGTLVWAKAETYPWWAAVVFEPDDPLVPSSVLEDEARHATGPRPKHLVQFYDQGRTWQWLDLDKLRLLGEDKALDEQLLSGGGKQKFKGNRVRAQCRASYIQAIAEMETQGDKGHEPIKNDDTGMDDMDS